jgi:hypothetical protein
MPRHCTPLPDAGWICTSGPRPPVCKYCGRLAGFQCDGAQPGTKKTCDVHLCEQHAQQVGEDLHLCADCFGKDSRWPKAVRQKELF